MRWRNRIALIATATIMSVLLILRATSHYTLSDSHQPLGRLSATSWHDFLPFKRKTRIAILHDRDPDNEDTFISVVYQLSREPTCKLTLFHGVFYSGYEEAVNTIWKGEYERYEDFSDPLAGQDVVVVTSSKVEKALKLLVPQLERHSKLRVVLTVHDSSVFDLLAAKEGGLALPDAVVNQVVSLVKNRKLSFLTLSEQVKDQLVSNLAMVDSYYNWSSYVHVHLPYIPAPRIQRSHQINQFRSFTKLGMTYTLAQETTGQPYMQALFADLEKVIRDDPTASGYKRGEPFVRMEGKGPKTLELHILSLDSFKHTQVVVPDVLKNVVKLHGHLEADAYYKLLSTMDLLLPAADLATSTNVDSAVALSLSARVPVLLPAQYHAPVLKHPAAIRFPKEMSVMTAVRMIRNGRDPRGKMAWMSRPWDRCDTVQDWTALVENVRKQNEQMWKSVLALRA